MKTVIAAGMSLLILAGLAGCGDSLPTDPELHFGIENKARPYAVVIEPAEAAPGDTVQVTLLARVADPAAVDIAWRVALDYDTGLYETDEVERNYREIVAPTPFADVDGFLNQSFTWVVPETVLRETSALPEVLSDEVMIALAVELMGAEAGSPPSRSAVDAWLRALTVAELATLDSPTREAVWALCDRFACQVRFRASVHTDLEIDVTRNLTVRHTGRLRGPNTNHNPEVLQFAVVALEKTDAEPEDLGDTDVAQTWYRFIVDGVRTADRTQVPRHSDWTYYLAIDWRPETYTSPFNPGLILTETDTHRWFYYRQDAPTAEHQLLVEDDGTELDSWNLGDRARIVPAGVGSTFRILATVRDERSEWAMYHAAPGVVAEEGVVEFVGP